jgi:hypothetical protein
MEQTAKELFKSKAEVVAALNELGIEYKKIMSGANIGNATQSYDELCVIFDLHKSLEKEKNNAVSVTEVPIFKQPVLTFNPMLFRFQ